MDSSIQVYKNEWPTRGVGFTMVEKLFLDLSIPLFAWMFTKRSLKESHLREICGVIYHLMLWGKYTYKVKFGLSCRLNMSGQKTWYSKTLWRTLYVNASSFTISRGKNFMSLWCILKYNHIKWPALSCCSCRVWGIISWLEHLTSLLAEMFYKRKLFQQFFGIIDHLTM